MNKLLIILPLLVGCSEFKTKDREPQCARDTYKPALHTRVAAFGDAITAGYNLTECPYSFADYVAAATGQELVMGAVTGSISDVQLEQINNTEILPTDTIIFIAGYNDMLFYGTDPVGMQTYADRFALMLQHLAPAKQILIGDGFTNMPIGYTDPSFPNGSDAKALIYSNLTKSIIVNSGLTNVTVVPTMNALNHNPLYYTRDQVHPNAEGQASLAQVFLEYLQ